MSWQDCAALVETGDPARFAATMAAPVSARARLMPLYAANLEIARAPWAASDPVIGEMRLQWWIDTIDDLSAGGVRPGHPVTEALAPMLVEHAGLSRLLGDIAEARRRDCWAEPFADRAELESYIDATAGNLMWAAAGVLGAGPEDEATVRLFANAAGMAAYFLAAPELAARGRHPLVFADRDMLRDLADAGLSAIRRARAARPRRAVLPAFWTGAEAEAVLGQVAADPTRIEAGRLGRSPLAGKLALARRVMMRTV
ncbi:MAG: squalene/phytoene synthase family protein [Rhodobacteraceae bacterium]|nr:squalene/phytoene synthase family protein [Paracoccaceae bacterium]